MAIDSTVEEPILLADAAKLLPSRPHVSTLWRWFQRGVKGHRLETLVVGGKRYTSREALQRFADRLTAASTGEPTSARTPRQRQRQIEQAEAELARSGA
ncbi:MAG: hypothetical protein DCC68_22150 [Planctomycetota bacterium]|nr:MAG: hypothetical protein DCC68_22150 [Planctomycetota bacterium]